MPSNQGLSLSDDLCVLYHVLNNYVYSILLQIVCHSAVSIQNLCSLHVATGLVVGY
jgi:hypothetical protein